MKQFYLGMLLTATFSLNVSGQQIVDYLGEKKSMKDVQMYYENAPLTRGGNTVEEILACPVGTVLGGELTADAGYSGFQSSDQGRPGNPSKYYQFFSGCYQSVNAVRFVGLFNYYSADENWLPCDSRGGMTEKGELTEAIRFEISFYKKGADGMPGECIHKEELDLYGDLLGVTYGEKENATNMYEFTAQLNKEVKLESGFFSVSAVDMKDNPTCWFALFCVDSSIGYGLIELGGYGMIGASNPMIFCLKGTGEYSAKKALKMTRVLTPGEYSGSKYEKVQVEIMNVGSEVLDNVRLELWAEGELLATEDVKASINSLGSYKYTFKQRVDCSAAGVHHIEIKNVTPGDEKLCEETLAFSTATLEKGTACESEPQYSFDDCCITSVNIGTISNQSEESPYSDFTHLKTNITLGDELDLAVKVKGGKYIGVWVDWDNNGTFDDAGEFIGYVTEGSLKVGLPKDVAVTEGEKRLRIVMTYDELPNACGDYYMGETEDYTLVVTRSEASPSVNVNVKAIEESLNCNSKSVALEISNAGTGELNAALSVNYTLPNLSTSRSMVNNAIEKKVSAQIKPLRMACREAESAPKTETSEEVQYTLKYDNGQDDCVALGNYNTAIFAHYYPGEVLNSLKGMQISSIDVYLMSAAKKSSIVIYGEKSQSTAGKVLVEQTFVPVENSWNHIVLKEPLTITGEDFWFGVKLEGMAADSYYIGVDGQKALRGFGDLTNVGGDAWWSMADLGIDNNFCIRANVIGERTPAINWLSLNQKELTIGAKQKATVNAELNAAELGTALYEAVIEINSNDALQQVVKIPVYLSNGSLVGLEKNEILKSSVHIADGVLVVESTEVVNSIILTDVAGNVRKQDNKKGRKVSFPLADLATGIYILSINYADGSQEIIKLPVVR